MEIKRSKVFKMKNQKREDDTAKEREFRNAVMKQVRFGRDEKIILGFGLVVLFLLSLAVDSEVKKAVLNVFIFLIGLAGIIR